MLKQYGGRGKPPVDSLPYCLYHATYFETFKIISTGILAFPNLTIQLSIWDLEFASFNPALHINKVEREPSSMPSPTLVNMGN